MADARAKVTVGPKRWVVAVNRFLALVCCQDEESVEGSVGHFGPCEVTDDGKAVQTSKCNRYATQSGCLIVPASVRLLPDAEMFSISVWGVFGTVFPKPLYALEGRSRAAGGPTIKVLASE